MVPFGCQPCATRHAVANDSASDSRASTRAFRAESFRALPPLYGVGVVTGAGGVGDGGGDGTAPGGLGLRFFLAVLGGGAGSSNLGAERAPHPFWEPRRLSFPALWMRAAACEGVRVFGCACEAPPCTCGANMWRRGGRGGADRRR